MSTIVEHTHRGRTHGRLGARRILAYFVLGFALLVGVSAVVGGLTHTASKPLCLPYSPCGKPSPLVRPVVDETVWSSPRYAYRVLYPPDVAKITGRDARGIILDVALPGGSAGALIINAERGGIGQAASVVKGELAGLSGLTAVAADANPSRTILGAGVGYHAGVGATFIGDLAAPQGVQQPVDISAVAASVGGLTVTVTVLGSVHDSSPNGPLYQVADQVINEVRWPGSAS